MAPRVVILDFDGTLVESVGIKDRAFEELFGDWPEWSEIEAYHLANNHVIRFEKFRHIVEEILGEEYTPGTEAALSARFSGLVADAIARAPWVPGALELLDALDAAGCRTYLLSMSPPDELAAILRARGIDERFADVYAHPWSKTAAAIDVLRREGVDPSEAVMVGDTEEDAEAAKAAGIPFLSRDSGRPMQHDAEVLKDMVEVLRLLGEEAHEGVRRS